SAANLLNLIERTDGKGYLLNGSPQPLGRFRREAFLGFSNDRNRLGEVQSEVQKSEGEEDWFMQLGRHITTLETTLEGAFDPKRSDQFLSLDIYQLNAEIRALRNKLRVEDVGL